MIYRFALMTKYCCVACRNNTSRKSHYPSRLNLNPMKCLGLNNVALSQNEYNRRCNYSAIIEIYTSWVHCSPKLSFEILMGRPCYANPPGMPYANPCYRLLFTHRSISIKASIIRYNPETRNGLHCKFKFFFLINQSPLRRVVICHIRILYIWKKNHSEERKK